MRYAVLTARHCDGFSLYDTRGLSDYDVMHTPNGRDLVAEFVSLLPGGGACSLPVSCRARLARALF